MLWGTSGTSVGNDSRFGVILYSYAKGGNVTPSRPCGRKRSPARPLPWPCRRFEGAPPGRRAQCDSSTHVRWLAVLSSVEGL